MTCNGGAERLSVVIVESKGGHRSKFALCCKDRSGGRCSPFSASIFASFEAKRPDGEAHIGTIKTSTPQRHTPKGCQSWTRCLAFALAVPTKTLEWDACWARHAAIPGAPRGNHWNGEGSYDREQYQSRGSPRVRRSALRRAEAPCNRHPLWPKECTPFARRDSRPEDNMQGMCSLCTPSASIPPSKPSQVEIETRAAVICTCHVFLHFFKTLQIET